MCDSNCSLRNHDNNKIFAACRWYEYDASPHPSTFGESFLRNLFKIPAPLGYKFTFEHATHTACLVCNWLCDYVFLLYKIRLLNGIRRQCRQRGKWRNTFSIHLVLRAHLYANDCDNLGVYLRHCGKWRWHHHPLQSFHRYHGTFQGVFTHCDVYREYGFCRRCPSFAHIAHSDDNNLGVAVFGVIWKPQ